MKIKIIRLFLITNFFIINWICLKQIYTIILSFNIKSDVFVYIDTIRIYRINQRKEKQTKKQILK